ncbi:MAG: DUF349 domain-containing protein [Marinifilaceae bacterium]
MEAKDLRNPSQEEPLKTNGEIKNATSDTTNPSFNDEGGKVAAEEDVETASENKQENKVEERSDDLEDLSEVDYSLLSKQELIHKLNDLLDTYPVVKLKSHVEEIKQIFYKKYQADLSSAEQKFVEAGGSAEEFEYEDDSGFRMKAILKKYREKKAEYNRKLEQEKEANLKLKYQIIDEIKELINRKESINKTFNEFQELQKKWREIGMVPQQSVKNLWETYHHHVENFYDYIKINKELRDLDLKKNLNVKIKLCEEAESLLSEASIVKAFNALQKLHERWREVGPVPREKKEVIWDRFKETTTHINKKHQEFYEGLRQEQKKNLEAKTKLCERAEAICNQEIRSHKDWNASSREILELQQEWRRIGFAPKKDNNRIYQRFRAACDLFFEQKRKFYFHLKEELSCNLELKIKLCQQAEALQDSTDWKKTTDELIAIQKKWKEIGPVPRKVSDEMWNRFREACDKFFRNKSAHFESMDSDQGANLKLKEELIERVKDFQITSDNEGNIRAIKRFQKEWAEIGHVPFKHKDRVQEAFRQAINHHFDRLNLDVFHKEVQRFRNKIDGYLEMEYSEDKIIAERNKIVNKIKHLESDITLWENNIGFFSNSKNSGNIIRDIQQKIEKGKKTLALLQEKLAIIDNLV